MKTLSAFCLFALLAGCTTSTLPATCQPECSAGFHCDNGTCVFDGNNDASVGPDGKSGTCDPACSGGTPHCNASNHCVGCLTDDDCPMGNYCKIAGDTLATCVSGCMTKDHCGGSKDCCSNQCTDTTTDPRNCGGCGMPCSANHAQASCTASKCQTGQCDVGYGDCDGDPKNGCEANLHVDTANCTMCGMGCALANAIPGCSDGCYISACDFGYDNCNGDDTDGCETQVLTDIANCGSCGTPCNGLPNAKATCTAGNCVLGQCNVGFFDCNNNPQDGCEVAVGTDVNNCGTCGNKCGNGLVCVNGGCTCAKCNFPNAASSCVNNTCVMGACVQGFADCNNSPNDGCEVNILTDGKNCNACGTVCPNNTPYCNNGVCVVQPPCDMNLEVTYMGHCYYLDGSGGKCTDNGYALASQAVLTNISMMFAGKNYKHMVSDNCCIWNADANENWGMSGHCNAPGPFAANDVAMGGAGCTNQFNHNPNQLTFCVK
jgi:hypothetical protein